MMRKKYGPTWSNENRIRQYDGVEEVPHRSEREKIEGKYLAPFDFWLSWQPGVRTEIANNEASCKRYWSGRPNWNPLQEPNRDQRELYCDERIDKCRLLGTATILAQLAKLLWDLAVGLEEFYYEGDTHGTGRQVDLGVPATIEMFEQSAEWFRCLAHLPYDATFRLEALLDCLVFLMGDEYGKYQLDSCYKIELLQLGFGFFNLWGRRQWVLAVETMLYNFNMQCKFQMPCKHEPSRMQHLHYFSLHRGLPEGMAAPENLV